MEEIQEILLKHDRIALNRWIKSNSAMDKLGISPGTLQNFRINGTIPFPKLGGIIYYDDKEIHNILMDNKIFMLKNRS